jgi:hypothetical protein
MVENARINKFMRIVDLWRDGEGVYEDYVFNIKFKDGTVIDDAKIKQTETNIKSSIEQSGGECNSVTFIKFENEE